MRPYGTDLRTRVIDAYQRGEGSVRELAELFELAPRTIQSWLNLVRVTGSAEPCPHRGGFPARMTAQRREILGRLVVEDPDATLPQLVEQLARATGCSVHPSTLSRALAQMDITRKKRPSTRRSVIDLRCSWRGSRSARGSAASPDTV